MCEVTVVIPNYNGKKYLAPCLSSLFQDTSAEFRVIVVDNGSEDGSIEEAERLYPEAAYVRLDKNYGFCRAVNIGIKRAATPFVLLLNNDTKVRRGFVKNLLDAVKKDPEVFSVEAKMIQYHNQGLIDSAGTFYNAFGWAFARGKGAAVDAFDKPCDTFASCGGAAIYRRDVFDIIGLFDERHFAYLEDVDIGYRAKIRGYTSRYEPGAQVVHVGSASSGSRYNKFKVYYSAGNNLYLVYKNMPLFQIILNFPALLAGFLAKFLFFAAKGYAGAYAGGLRRGIHLCKKGKKVPFQKKYFINYLRIQLELWRNMARKPV